MNNNFIFKLRKMDTFFLCSLVVQYSKRRPKKFSEQLTRNRIKAVLAVHRGCSMKEVAVLFDRSVGQVAQWVRAGMWLLGLIQVSRDKYGYVKDIKWCGEL